MHEKILIVEDELIVAGDIKFTLEEAGYQVTGIARSVDRALELLEANKPFLVLVDIHLKGPRSGIKLAAELHNRNIPFIFLSANSNKEILDSANITQPFGFIVKPFRSKDLLVSLGIAKYRYEQQLHFRTISPSKKQKATVVNAGTNANNIINGETKDDFEGIIGKSAAMLSIFSLIKRVAPTDTSVLILGESGTGKESVANAIHKLSSRKDKPFIKINCAALPTSLIESELFGHEKGVFTGAFEKRIGKFEKADGGTVFLDEIGEMPLDMQVKLLRVLQEREIERIGGKEPFKIDVRIIAATNRNLETEIAERRFRLDLYYRLYVFPIEVPSLRNHKDDIPLLAKHFMQLYAGRIKKSVTTISDKVSSDLLNYSWPGNVRELQNVIERAVVLAQDNELQQIKFSSAENHNQAQINPYSKPVRTIDEVERDHILDVLNSCNQRISGPGGAAELLKLPPTTLASKMKKLGIVKKHTGDAYD